MKKLLLVVVVSAFGAFSGCQSAPQSQNQQAQFDENGNRKLSSEEAFQKELAAEHRECKYGEKKNEAGDCERIDSFHRPFKKNGR